jgi:hypothetical protein
MTAQPGPVTVTRRWLVVLVAALVLPLSARGGDRFYAGEPRPENEVGLVLVHGQCALGWLTPAGAARMQLQARMRAELLPGRYTFCVGYVNARLLTTETSRGCVDLDLEIRPGHVYFIFPEVGDATWRPAALDFASPADFADQKDGARVLKKAKKYFAGPRAPVTLSKLGTWE